MFLKNLCHPDFVKKAVGDVFHLGSHTDNNFVVEGAAPKHARIDKKDDRYFVKDLKSSTGTFLNGVRIVESYLSAGDILKISETEFLFGPLHPPQQNFEHLLKSHNVSWQQQLQCLPKMALTDLPILLLGPSGTGKELISQIIHHSSERCYGPIYSVNCSALTENLAESELFGHVKGSFTGATQDRKGAFESARNGTLVLDEVGDLPLNLQPKLLRALENKEMRPVGSDRTISTNVRIIACTHQNLKQKVEQGAFRLDLFYRLNVIQVQIPSLNNRMEDFEKILFEFARENQIKFLPDAILALKNHEWPGNIRELKNFVQRAKATYGDDPVDCDMAMDLIEGPIEKNVTPKGVSVRVPMRGKASGGSLIKQIEKKLIKERLVFYHGNQRRVAQDLGIPKSTLHDKIKYYGINVEDLLDKHWTKQIKVSKEAF